MVKQFVPLESSPQVFNEFMYKLGISPKVAFNDVFSLDQDMLGFVPRPVYALVLTFPISEKYETYRQEQDENLKDDYYDEVSGTDKERALWFKQTIRNACGTMALLHAVANGIPKDAIESNSAIDRLLTQAKPMSSKQRIELLENNSDLESLHGQVAQMGDTAAPEADQQVEHHYVCLTIVDGHLYELDGRRKGPIDLGPISSADADALCAEAIQKVHEFMNRETTPAFNIMALCENS